MLAEAPYVPERRQVPAGKPWDRWALWGIAAAALAAVVWFDLRVSLPSNDDWVYAWSVRQLVAGHGLRLLPEQSALALVQVGWASLVSLGHPSLTLMRLSLLPFALLAAVATFRLSTRLGARPFWAGLAGLSLIASPIFLSLATTFMTELFYLGLLMAAALAGFYWVEQGRASLVCGALILLAGLERQSGVALVAAVTVGLLAARSRRTVLPREWFVLGTLWLCAPLVLLLPSALGLSTGAHRLAGLVTANPLRLVLAATFFPPILGLLLSPFLLALAFATRARARAPRLLLFGCVALAEAGALNLGSTALHGLGLLKYSLWNPGNYLKISGLNPVLLFGSKPPIYPVALFLLVQAMAIGTFVAILVYHRVEWTRSGLRAGSLFLMSVAGTQMLPIVQGQIFDRYLLVVVAPLIPLIAALASRTTRPKLAAAWAFMVLGLWLGMYVVGEQDYQAWLVARDRAAQLVYKEVPPSEVQAGYEANAIYWELPLYERTGKPVGPLPSDLYGEPSVNGPPNPRFRLEFAGPGDPRPGVSDWSLAPGRIVIVPLPQPTAQP